MNTWKVILATLVIFGTGVVTGGLLVVYSNAAAHHAEKVPEAEGPKHNSPPAPGPGAPRDPRVLPVAQHFLLRKEFLKRLDEELKLTPEQRERIEKIMGEGQQHIQELSQQIDPQVRAEIVATRERIRAQLTPPQQTQYAELLKRRPNNPPRGPTNAINALPAKPQR